MSVLDRYFARRAVQQLTLSDAMRRRVLEVCDRLEQDGRVRVSVLHEDMYPECSTKTANTNLSRLVTEVNKAAAVDGVPVSMEISKDRRAGAAGRWVWFRGQAEPPEPVTPELDRAARQQLILAPAGIPSGAAPVVVLFTYNANETAAVLDAFPGDVKREEVREGVTYTDLGLIGGHRVVLRVSEQGPGRAQLAAEDACRVWAPKALISVGIAFGADPARQSIGDVLVPRAAYDYESQRRSPGGVIEPRGLPYPASDVLYGRVRHLDQTQTSLQHWPRVWGGLLLSGAKLIDDAEVKREIARLAPTEPDGGEMEGVGVAMVAGARKVDWLLVKGICDWADGNVRANEKENNQRTAARNAVIVVRALLSDGPLWGDPQPKPTWAPPPTGEGMQVRELGRLTHLIEDQTGTVVGFHKDWSLDRASELLERRAEGVDVLNALLEWIDGTGEAKVFAILGEYGMGKTITCQRLARALEQRLQRTQTGPIPLYFDLRLVTGLSSQLPTLEQVLTECMQRGWLADTTSTFTSDQVFAWIAHGAVVIFDGLDEVLVKLDAADGQTFTRTLLSIVDRAPTPTRVVVSCRTQYFKTLRDQQNHFTGHERGDAGADTFRALTLLPLTEEQVLAYLRGVLPGEDPDRVVDVLRSVHNLEDLSRRPYTLSLIADFFPALEARRAEGRPVYGVTLYEGIVDRWLDRDEGKHRIRRDHKLLLARDLAAFLWRRQQTALPATDIEDWFNVWRTSSPALASRYAATPVDQLEEDLRTATFLARVDAAGGGGGFRFAHTSLQEYFLAAYLADGLQADRRDTWSLPPPSRETFAFLAQILAETGGPDAYRRLSQWCRTRTPQLNENVLAFSLHVRRDGAQGPSVAGIQLTGADLSDWVLDATLPTGRLDLRGADLTGCTGRRMTLVQVSLDGARLDGADLRQTELLDCTDLDVDWSTCNNIDGALWRTSARTTDAQPCGADQPGSLVWLAPMGPVRSVAYSPDGARVVTGGADGAARIWDAATGEVLTVLAGHTGPVRSVAYSPDGARVVTGDDYGAARIWDAATGEVLTVLAGHTGPVRSVAYSPDGARVVTGDDYGAARIWDAATGEVVTVLAGHTASVMSVAYSPDGARVVTGDADGAARIWDAATGEVLTVLAGHTDSVMSVAYSPDGARVVTGDADGAARIWDAATGEVLTVLAGHTDSVMSVAYSPDGARVVTGDADGAARIWDAATGEVLTVLAGHTDSVRSVAYSPDGARVVTGGADGAARIWDAATGEVLTVLAGHTGPVRSVAYSPDGARVVTGGADGAARIWDAATGEVLTVLAGHTAWVMSVAYSPDGARVVTGDADGAARIWDAATGEVLTVLAGHTGPVRSVAYSPDGARVVTGGADGAARIWDAATGEVLTVLAGHTAWVMSVAYSPDGARVVTGDADGAARIWDAATGDVLTVLAGHTASVMSVAYSPDGARVVTGDAYGAARIWDAATGEVLTVLAGHTGPVRSVAYSPDGARVVTGGADGAARIWDAATGEVLTVLAGHTAWVMSVAYSPDGARVVTGGADGAARIWDAATGEVLMALGIVARDRTQARGAIAWDPQSNRILYGAGTAWRQLRRRLQSTDGQRLVRLTSQEVPGPMEHVEALKNHTRPLERTP